MFISDLTDFCFNFISGVLGMILTLAYGAHKYKTAKHQMSTSVFLMQLRVAAQSAVIGCIGIGMIFNMIKTLKNYGKSSE